MAYKKCTKCDSMLPLNVEFAFCGGICKTIYCLKCTGLSRQEYKTVSENENISWNCDARAVIMLVK